MLALTAGDMAAEDHQHHRTELTYKHGACRAKQAEEYLAGSARLAVAAPTGPQEL